MRCAVHGVEMTLKPAGVSKAGRSYPAFWSCGVITDGSFCKWKPDQAGATSARPAPAKTIAEYEDAGSKSSGGQPSQEYWEKREAKKSHAIARSVAYKAAIDLRIAGILKDDQVWPFVASQTEKLLEEPMSDFEKSLVDEMIQPDPPAFLRDEPFPT
jgi:hypothetical protein